MTGVQTCALPIFPFLPDRILAQVIRSLLDHGIELYRVEEKRQNLEDIYLGMVKEAGL